MRVRDESHSGLTASFSEQGSLMRAMFVAYLTFILAGLTFCFYLGIANR